MGSKIQLIFYILVTSNAILGQEVIIIINPTAAAETSTSTTTPVPTAASTVSTSTPVAITTTLVPTTAPAVFTTPVTVTTTAVPFTTGACTGPANYSAPTCTQYYSCVYVMWWWDHKLLDCPTGEGFDGTAGNCTASATCLITTLPTSTSTSAAPVVTTSTTVAPTTTVPAVTAPTCSGPGTYAGPQCNQYYQCTQIIIFWTTQLETCSTGLAYIPSTGNCAVDPSCVV